MVLVRMLAVAVSLLGIGTYPATVGFIGWFGPRGLASLVFALLVPETPGIADGGEIFAVAAWTVILSIFLHGMSAAPSAALYGRWASKRTPRAAEHEPVQELPTRAIAWTTSRRPAGDADTEKAPVDPSKPVRARA